MRRAKTIRIPALATLLYVDWLPQVNGPPRALLSNFVDHKLCRHSLIVDSWTLFMRPAPHKCPRSRVVDGIHPLVTLNYGLATGSRTKPRYAARSILDASFQDVISSSREWILRRIGNISGHHPQNKEGQFTCDRGFCNVVLGTKSGAIVFAQHTFIGFICVSDNFRRITVLSGPKYCALFFYWSTVVYLGSLK